MARTMRTGITKQMMGLFEDDPKALWTWHDLHEALEGTTEKAIQNCVHRLFTEGRVFRHIDKSEETSCQQYALNIPPTKRDEYVKQEKRTGIMKPKRKKGQMPTSREIRTMFAQTQNQMAKMEDMMVAVVEEAEVLEKMMNKIRNISNL